MRFKPRKIEIDQSEPFKNDLLKRREFIENIMDLINISDDSLNIALTGKYGFGKTTALKMLCCHANNSGNKSIYFNAWENDYIDDPFSAILTELTELLPESSEIKDKLIDAGINVLKIGVPALVKAATMNIVDLSSVTEEVIGQITSEFASAELEKHLVFKKDIEKFKKQLNTAVEALVSDDLKVIVVVDELDRCKPTYAVKLLEAIKHLFDIDNITFIIGIDFNQLRESVSHLYGNNTDTDGYLRRFFDLQIELGEPELKDYINYLFDSYGLQEVFEERAEIRENQYDRQQFGNILYVFGKYYKASLRDIEKCFNIFSYVLSTTEKKYLIFPGILAYLIILFLFDIDLYYRFIKYKVEMKELVNKFYDNNELFELMKTSRDINETYFIGQLCITAYKPYSRENPYEYFDTILGDDSTDEKYKEYIKEIKEAAQHFRRGSRFDDVMTYIENKMMFVDKIKSIST